MPFVDTVTLPFLTISGMMSEISNDFEQVIRQATGI